MAESVVLRCPRCGREYPTEATACTHPDCTGESVLEPVRDGTGLSGTAVDAGPDAAGRADIWRYGSLFPVDTADPVTLGEGWTPLVGANALGADLAVDLQLKLETGNPTGSTKDRGSSVLATHAVASGHEKIACASTGNAAASIAAYAAHCGLDCSLFVPGDLPETKAVQPRMYGAEVVPVDGDYAAACEQCARHVERHGGLDRSAGASAHVTAGARTLGFELAEQTHSVPDWVVVPMGNGGTLAALWEGWETFYERGHVDTTPRLLGVQADAVSPIYECFHGESDAEKVREGTCADSIAVTEPHCLDAAVSALEKSGGTAVRVDDAAIRSATATLGRRAGVFAEPASAATLAGLEAAREAGFVAADSAVVAVVTGTGLKDARAARRCLDE